METEITDLSGNVKMPIIDIFSMAIRYLKDHALETLNNPRTPDVKVGQSDVYFVLTVPAIWDEKARLFMREAAAQVRLSYIYYLGKKGLRLGGFKVVPDICL